MIVFSVKVWSALQARRMVKNCRQTIINIVQMSMRIVRVIDDQWATKSVAILQFVVGVVPVGTRLIFSVEPILKLLARFNGTLSYERNAVGPVGSVLEYSVPVLKTNALSQDRHEANVE